MGGLGVVCVALDVLRVRAKRGVARAESVNAATTDAEERAGSN